LEPPTFAGRVLKRLVLSTCGVGSWWQLSVRNRFAVWGAGHLRSLPERNVLFVSNHETYFLDVMAIYHSIASGRAAPGSGLSEKLLPVSFIAAHETMNKGLLPRFLKAAGAVCVHRTWREGDQQVSRRVETAELFQIGRALNAGWLVTFPQGTTREGAPGRRGTAHLIAHHRPVVVPVVVGGFRQAFDKTGLQARRPGSALSLRFKPPLEFDDYDDIEGILVQVMEAIEQAPAGSSKRARPALA
jgi:1-acyl-sn-glycerol-3-phosphate acyltransferase